MSKDSTQTKTQTETHAGGAAITESLKIQQLFKLMVDNGGSDLHLTPGTAPAMRVNGDIVRVKLPALDASCCT